MNSLRALVLLCLVLLLAGCDDERKNVGGVSGHSFVVGNRFVILDNGYHQGDVTWVVVRDWPIASSPEQRLADKRLVLDADGIYRVRQPSDDLGVPTAGVAYIFDDNILTTFSIRMREDDYIGFANVALNTYSDVESFLRRFERKR